MASSGISRRLAVVVLDRGKTLEEVEEVEQGLRNSDGEFFSKCGESGVYSAIFENPQIDECTPRCDVVRAIVQGVYEDKESDLRDADGFFVDIARDQNISPKFFVLSNIATDKIGELLKSVAISTAHDEQKVVG